MGIFSFFSRDDEDDEEDDFPVYGVVTDEDEELTEEQIAERTEERRQNMQRKAEKLKANDCAISVYVPAAGDDLWSTAKSLRQSPEEIKTTNPDLAFPLTGKERILVFRGKSE